MAHVATDAGATELVVTLLGIAGTPRPELNGQVLVASGSLVFLACSELSGVQVSWRPLLDSALRPRYLRLYFAGVTETDTWNSWLRAPQLPPVGALQLNPGGDGAPERRFQVTLGVAADALPVRDGTLIELALTKNSGELPAESVTVRFPPGPYLLQRIALATTPYDGEPLICGQAPPLPQYPEPQLHLPASGDPLSARLYSLAADAPEPTLQHVWQLALPFRGAALLGAVEAPIVAQLWDGGLVWPEPSGAYSRMWLRIGLPTTAGSLTHAEQRLRNGYLPIAESTLKTGSGDEIGTLEQTAFVDLQGILRLRAVVRSQGARPALLYQAMRAGLTKSLNQSRAQACIYEPLPTTLTQSTLRFGDHKAPVQQRWLPDGSSQLDLTLSLPGRTPDAAVPTPSFDDALRAVQNEAEQFLAAGAQLDLPDPHLQNAWRALLLHNRLFQRDGILRYGLFPGVYDGGLFGVEEGWNIVALAQYGHPKLAHALLARTFFAADFLKKEGQHHQYRSGLCITYARDVYNLTGDEAALRVLWPQIAENAEWITTAFRSTQVPLPSGERPVHYGLLPKHTYGGDLTEPAYSLYGSSAAWRGLRDASLLARIVGDPRAESWSQAAHTTRQHLHTAAERIYKSETVPPFLPFRTDESASAAAPSAGDYHQLFASLILETALFGWQGKQARQLTDYLLASGRQTLGIARFDQWFGRPGVDAEYSRGTQLCALHRRDFDRFYLGLLGQLGLSCDPHTFVSPETAIVRFTAQEYQERMRTIAEQPARFDSDPCSAGTAVMLQYLRYLLVLEQRDEDDLPTGTLWLGAGAPPSWFLSGRTFSAENLPTELGTISLRCTSSRSAVTYRIKTARPLPVEVFYFDSAGRHLSQRALISGEQTVIVSR